jgi:hypothetical protein
MIMMGKPKGPYGPSRSEYVRTCMASTHGFKQLPKMNILALVRCAIKVLNQFPALDGVSDTLSLLTIITGRSAPNCNAMKIKFSVYAQVIKHKNPSNTIKAWTTGAIALGPMGNAGGYHYFMSLSSWKHLSQAQ